MIIVKAGRGNVTVSSLRLVRGRTDITAILTKPWRLCGRSRRIANAIEKAENVEHMQSSAGLGDAAQVRAGSRFPGRHPDNEPSEST